MKFKSLKIIAMSIALMLVMPMNAFATPINLDNSTESVATDILDKANRTDYFVDEDTNVWQNGSITEEARVTVSRTSQFEVTIPKEVVLNGSTGTATYKIKAKGDIAGDQKITVTPDASFVLSEAGGKNNVIATVTQANTEYDYVKLQGEGTEYDGNISATLTAGEWSGKFNFNIKFKDSSTPTGPTLPAKAAFNDMSWSDISTVSEAGKAPEYFNVGDEKELTIGEYSYYDSDNKITVTHPETTYHVQILGFNHDDKSDGTGKAGITVGLKEAMTTKHNMNDRIIFIDNEGIEWNTYTNIGGWETSKMRTYLQNDVLVSLPSDLQAVIKTVDKKSDVGNKNTSTLKTTQDKLFLFSPEEVGFILTSDYLQGQGTKYEYFIDDNSRVKKYLSGELSFWWLRSANIGSHYFFYHINRNGSNYYSMASDTIGVVFGFSI